MGWGKTFIPDVIENFKLTDKVPVDGDKLASATAINAIWQNAQANLIKEIDLTAGVIFTETKIENGEIKQRIIPPEEYLSYDDPMVKDATTEHLVKAYAEVINRNNMKPTHDPYTNPNSHIYYECKCGEILDPQTKSFAQLNSHASEKGWKVRFGADGYTPYCVKCGEDVE